VLLLLLQIYRNGVATENEWNVKKIFRVGFTLKQLRKY
jgi:hypothetical protein